MPIINSVTFTDGKLKSAIPETDESHMRRFRAQEVAKSYLITEWGDNQWKVGSFKVTLSAVGVECSCPDFRGRQLPCKHIFAAAYHLGDTDAVVERMVINKSASAAKPARDRQWRSSDRPQNVRIGKHFMLSDFLYSETAALKGIANCPKDFDGAEVNSLRHLAAAILDPVVEQFGSVSVTYGYVCPELHVATYGTSDFGLHNCVPLKGQTQAAAADILVHSRKDNPREVFNWIRDNCVFDRLILYPGSSIICVAWSDKPRRHAKEWIFVDGESKPRYINAGRQEPLIREVAMSEVSSDIPATVEVAGREPASRPSATVDVAVQQNLF